MYFTWCNCTVLYVFPIIIFEKKHKPLWFLRLKKIVFGDRFQARLKLAIPLLQCPKCWDYSCAPTRPTLSSWELIFLKVLRKLYLWLLCLSSWQSALSFYFDFFFYSAHPRCAKPVFPSLFTSTFSNELCHCFLYIHSILWDENMESNSTRRDEQPKTSNMASHF